MEPSNAVRSLNQRQGSLELRGFRTCFISSFEDVGFEYRAHYEHDPKYDRQWPEYHSAPPVPIEEITVSERNETEPDRGNPEGDEDNAVQWPLWVRVKHFGLRKYAANLQAAEKLPHALQSAIEFGHRGGVGNADVFFSSEAFSGDCSDVHLAQQFAGDVGRRVDPATPEKLLREVHVATVPGEGFGTKEHIRVSYATSMAELDRGLERMRKFFGGL